MEWLHRKLKKTARNSTYPKGGVSCSKDSLVVNGSLVFQIKLCGKSPALRVAAKRLLTKQMAICWLSQILENNKNNNLLYIQSD